ncbi:Hypothetical protein, putative [Bodo saltans]|uniref:Uncharacterized protein n=1 Tax=Bodo saltans TaxID=75058 RepID=A0A0S4JH15_BODSA|nr:Hypothetical protein, putative [Bodo saltans]|eukprot:CUG89796.1 Hypothetical protein, putative [Bodo saltans]
MKWIPLHLSKTAEVERQVDEVCKTLGLLCKQKESSSNAAQVAKAKQVLVHSMQDRIKELEQFYLENDLDVRASKIEQCRIKLKKGLAGAGFSHQQQPRADISTTPATFSAATLGGGTPSMFPAEPSSAIGAAPVAPDATPSSTNYSALLNPSTFDLAGAAMRSPPSSTNAPYGTIPNNRLASGLGGAGGGGDETQVLLRVVMSQEDFEELKLRRAAISKFLRGGAAGNIGTR